MQTLRVRAAQCKWRKCSYRKVPSVRPCCVVFIRVFYSTGACCHPVFVLGERKTQTLPGLIPKTNPNAAALRKYCQSVAKPLVPVCKQCGLDLTPDGID